MQFCGNDGANRVAVRSVIPRRPLSESLSGRRAQRTGALHRFLDYFLFAGSMIYRYSHPEPQLPPVTLESEKVARAEPSLPAIGHRHPFPRARSENAPPCHIGRQDDCSRASTQFAPRGLPARSALPSGPVCRFPFHIPHKTNYLSVVRQFLTSLERCVKSRFHPPATQAGETL